MAVLADKHQSAVRAGAVAGPCLMSCVANEVSMKTILFSCLSLALLATSCSPGNPSARIGAAAPALQIAHWVRGEPIDLAAVRGQRVVVVEFWATWCPPCKVSVPLLTKIQSKFEKELVIVGVTAPDFRGNSPEAIRKFVKGQGKDMAYHVAIDKAEATTNAYMLAAQVMGIPHAFLVGRDGRIAWSGSPLDPALEDTIAQVVAGTYDVRAAKIDAELQRRLPGVIRALQMGEPSVAWDGLIDILKLDPGNETALDILTSVHADHIRDTQAFRKWARAFISAHNKDATTMSRLTNALCRIGDLTMRTPDLALEAGRYAYEAAKGDPHAIAAYARALSQVGEFERAIRLQKDALAAANGKDTEMLEDTLDYYNLCKQLQGSKD